jgi:Fe2+ transport system protein B
MVNIVIGSGASMDPVTLFALANGAVSAVKAGCKLYKDIKGAAGDVKDVLKDLDSQFHKVYEAKGKTPPPEAIKQLKEEKARVVELNKQANSNEQTNIYTQIGEELGKYYDNYYKCQAIFEEEERRSKTQVYHGDSSLGKRALQRVLMRKQLEQMSTELRELMVYQSPPELGALYTEVEEMMKVMGKEQKTAMALEIQRHNEDQRRRRQRNEKMTRQAAIGVGIVVVIFATMFLFMYAIGLRQERFPDLGNCPMPKGSWMYYKWTNTVWASCH